MAEDPRPAIRKEIARESAALRVLSSPRIVRLVIDPDWRIKEVARIEARLGKLRYDLHEANVARRS